MAPKYDFFFKKNTLCKRSLKFIHHVGVLYDIYFPVVFRGRLNRYIVYSKKKNQRILMKDGQDKVLIYFIINFK